MDTPTASAAAPRPRPSLLGFGVLVLLGGLAVLVAWANPLELVASWVRQTLYPFRSPAGSRESPWVSWRLGPLDCSSWRVGLWHQ